MSIIKKKIILQPGTRRLVDDELVISSGKRYGLIGENGCGKTTLLGWINQHLNKLGGIRIGYIEQNISDIVKSEQTVSNYLVGQDIYRLDLLKQKSEIEKLLYASDDENDEDDDFDIEYYSEKLNQIEDDLREIKSNSAINRAQSILKGLGFSLNQQIKELSGGWLMRLQLAKLLYLKPDVLLLDEPTNHLDISAIEWLENYLACLNKKQTLIVVSHDQHFLTQVCDNYIRIQNQKLCQSSKLKFGDFKTKTKNLFGYNDDIKYGCYNIQLHEVEFKYKNKVIFDDVDLHIDPKSKIGIFGINGAGKSTLLKLIIGELKPLSGKIIKSRKLNVFRLEQIPITSSTLNSIGYLQKVNPKLKTQEIRQLLGKAGLKGNLHTQTLKNLSGGQLSRLMIAKILVRKPHILLLDEPTNHLDLEGINILINALKTFNGGIVIVSHNQHIIYSICNEIYEISGGDLSKISNK